MKLLQLGKIVIGEPVYNRMMNDIHFFMDIQLALKAYENGIFDENSERHLDEAKNGKKITTVYPTTYLTSANAKKIIISTSADRTYTVVNVK